MQKFTLVVGRQEAHRRWVRLMILFGLLAAVGSAVVAFRGVIPTTLPIIDYLACLFMGVAAPITVGILPKNLLEGEVECDQRTLSLAAIAFPVGGFLAWVVMMWEFMQFLDGWQPSMSWMFSNGFGFWGSTIVQGFLLAMVLIAVLTRHLDWIDRRDKRRRQVVS